MHSQGVIHRDLKPANIYLDGKGIVKIGDFGLATLARESNFVKSIKLNSELSEGGNSRSIFEYSRQTGTPLYTAPEQELSTKYNDKADVYTLGIILFELLSKFSTFH